MEEEWYADFERVPGQISELPEGEKLFGQELRLEADQILEKARRQLSRVCSSIETRVMEGNPANELLEQAEIGEYDLGSVSFKLASYASCSVAVIR
jgi:nucleotide-binding universal stress UspA family protein